MKGFPRFLRDCLFPRRCVSCNEFSEGGFLCEGCLRKLKASPGAGQLTESGRFPVHSPFLTCEPLLGLVRFLKFEGGTAAVKWLGSHMAVTLRGAARDLRDPVLVPVPLHWSRRARRGYDQARLLTAETARITGLPSAGRILFRSRRTLPQSRLSGVKRAGNVSGSFRAGKAARLGGRDVILVDDLVTTGATVLACREALLAAAPASISVLCAGRSGEIKNKVGLADSHMFE